MSFENQNGGWKGLLYAENNMDHVYTSAADQKTNKEFKKKTLINPPKHDSPELPENSSTKFENMELMVGCITPL